MKRAAAPVLLLSLLVGACGYFNSLYNAQRRFAEAERSARAGATTQAQAAYAEAIERAAVSYRKHPDSRWSDDALLLIGRARFAMGEHAAARAALNRVLEQSTDEKLRTTASLYLGASLVRLGQPDSALAPLDRAAAGTAGGSEEHALARLWLGRARLDTGVAEGWDDLGFTAGRGAGALALEASLETAARAVAAHDSTRALAGLTALAHNRSAGARLDTVFVLLRRAAGAWGGAAVSATLPAAVGREWQAEARTAMRAERAALLAAGGDTAAAVTAALAAAEQSNGEAAGSARAAAARWLLAGADSVGDLAHVRAVLLPAINHAGALQHVRRVRTVELLLEQGRSGEPAALFAAAEYARDTLRAPRLAHRLFLDYADAADGTIWAPKALLAALPLATESDRSALEQRIRAQPGNPYVAAVQGTPDPDAYYAAEEQLGRSVGRLRAAAMNAALTGDVRVGRAVAMLDSLRRQAVQDSLTASCGALVDSLALKGIRADSVRAACSRADSASLGRFLTVDTLTLRDSAATTGARPGQVRDTLQVP